MKIEQANPAQGQNGQAIESRSSARKAYAQPQLMTYGALTNITSGGSVGTTEGAKMTSLMRHP